MVLVDLLTDEEVSGCSYLFCPHALGARTGGQTPLKPRTFDRGYAPRPTGDGAKAAQDIPARRGARAHGHGEGRHRYGHLGRGGSPSLLGGMRHEVSYVGWREDIRSAVTPPSLCVAERLRMCSQWGDPLSNNGLADARRLRRVPSLPKEPRRSGQESWQG
jgi:hypothetical protein